MCGMFNMSESAEKKLKKLAKSFSADIPRYHTGIMRPAGSVPLLAGKELMFSVAEWGIRMTGKKIVINARSESAGTSFFFRNAVNNRCVTACASFFEKDGKGEKYEYFSPEKDIMLLGGILQPDVSPAFALLTREATSTKNIHRRVPSVISEKELYDFLNGMPFEEISEKTFIVNKQKSPEMTIFDIIEN